jgi:hypothetical protein
LRTMKGLMRKAKKGSSMLPWASLSLEEYEDAFESPRVVVREMKRRQKNILMCDLNPVISTLLYYIIYPLLLL